MAQDKETFSSMEELRAHFYPMSAPLVDLDPEEIVEFPPHLAEESLRTIDQIAARVLKGQAAEPQGN